MRRVIIIVGALLLVAVLAAAVVVLPGLQAGRAQAVAATTAVQRLSLNDSVESTGTISAERTAYLAFGTAGTVSTVNAAVGDVVRQGQPLATLDTIDLELQVALREDAVAIAQAQLDQLLAELSPRDRAQAEANIAAAEAQLTGLGL